MSKAKTIDPTLVYKSLRAEQGLDLNPLLPKSIVPGNTMAYIITSKYTDGLPLYRLSAIPGRYGIEILWQTLSESVLKAAETDAPLIDHMRRCLLDHIQVTIDVRPL